MCLKAYKQCKSPMPSFLNSFSISLFSLTYRNITIPSCISLLITPVCTSQVISCNAPSAKRMHQVSCVHTYLATLKKKKPSDSQNYVELTSFRKVLPIITEIFQKSDAFCFCIIVPRCLQQHHLKDKKQKKSFKACQYEIYKNTPKQIKSKSTLWTYNPCFR